MDKIEIGDVVTVEKLRGGYFCVVLSTVEGEAIPLNSFTHASAAAIEAARIGDAIRGWVANAEPVQ